MTSKKTLHEIIEELKQEAIKKGAIESEGISIDLDDVPKLVREWLQQKRENYLACPEAVYFIHKAYLKIYAELLEELQE